jgi:hypothetical protein
MRYPKYLDYFPSMCSHLASMAALHFLLSIFVAFLRRRLPGRPARYSRGIGFES